MAITTSGSFIPTHYSLMILSLY